MQIWVDADACPNRIKEVLFRAAVRTQTLLILVCNHVISIPPSPFIIIRQVEAGFDRADAYIVANVSKGDLIITADIPLADLVISKECTVLNPRGWLYNQNNIKQILSLRNFNQEMRDAGMLNSGPPKLTARDVQAFANGLDKFLGKNIAKHRC